MKEFTRIITLKMEYTLPEVDDGDVPSREETAKNAKHTLETMFGDATVHVIKVQDFIKDGDGEAEGEQK